MGCWSDAEIAGIAARPSPADQIAAMRGAWVGRRCFILACGLSITEYPPEVLAERLKGHPVLAIKQAFDYAPTACDLLLLNSWNYQRFSFEARRPLIVREAGSNDPPVFGETDVLLPVLKAGDLSEQLARRKNFDDFTFDRGVARPWGPGVLYEIGFYLAVHLGVSEIVTLGWDIGVKNTAVMPHFYDRPDPRKTRILAAAADMTSIPARNRFLHDNGVLYNKPRIIPSEVDACADVSGDWADWLAGRGIGLSVVSHQSMAAPRIPRVRLESVT